MMEKSFNTTYEYILNWLSLQMYVWKCRSSQTHWPPWYICKISPETKMVSNANHILYTVWRLTKWAQWAIPSAACLIYIYSRHYIIDMWSCDMHNIDTDIANSLTFYSQISVNMACQTIAYQLISDSSCPISSYCLIVICLLSRCNLRQHLCRIYSDIWSWLSE